MLITNRNIFGDNNQLACGQTLVSHEDTGKIKITWFYYNNTGRTWETPKQLLSARTELRGGRGGRKATVRSAPSSTRS